MPACVCIGCRNNMALMQLKTFPSSQRRRVKLDPRDLNMRSRCSIRLPKLLSCVKLSAWLGRRGVRLPGPQRACAQRALQLRFSNLAWWFSTALMRGWIVLCAASRQQIICLSVCTRATICASVTSRGLFTGQLDDRATRVTRWVLALMHEMWHYGNTLVNVNITGNSHSVQRQHYTQKLPDESCILPPPQPIHLPSSVHSSR